MSLQRFDYKKIVAFMFDTFSHSLSEPLLGRGGERDKLYYVVSSPMVSPTCQKTDASGLQYLRPVDSRSSSRQALNDCSLANTLTEACETLTQVAPSYVVLRFLAHRNCGIINICCSKILCLG